MRSATQPYCNNGWIRLCLTAHAIFFPKFYQGLRHRLTAKALGSRLVPDKFLGELSSILMQYFLKYIEAGLMCENQQ